MLDTCIPFTPSEEEKRDKLAERLNEVKQFLMVANRNNREQCERIVDVKNILMPINFLKKLMMSQHKNTAYTIFMKFVDLYSDNEISEIVDILDEAELNNILKTIKYERKYLVDKPLANTSLEYLCKKRLEGIKNSRSLVDNEQWEI